MSNRVIVESAARLHIGFQNLVPGEGRLFESVGVGIDRPLVRVGATPADEVRAEDPSIAEVAETAVDILGVDGVRVELIESFPRHVGLGSGTQLALSTYTAIARAHGLEPDPRADAPKLGRGRRSGIGVGAFERGGFLIDEGQPAADNLYDQNCTPDWSVPAVRFHRPIPESWWFLLVLPETTPGRHGENERESLRAAISSASAETSRAVRSCVEECVIPGIERTDIETFGAGLTRVDRLTGDWFAGAQGARHRPPADQIIPELEDDPTILGTGQSSWGPLVYALTREEDASLARKVGCRALEAAGCDGRTWIARPRNTGAREWKSDACMSKLDRTHSGETIL